MSPAAKADTGTALSTARKDADTDHIMQCCITDDESLSDPVRYPFHGSQQQESYCGGYPGILS